MPPAPSSSPKISPIHKGSKLDDDFPRCAVIAHRGASALQPENTLEALRLAMDIGAHGMEVDVKRTAEGELVLMHDATVTRTTGALGYVHRMTYTQLARLNAGYGFRPFHLHVRIPRLRDVLHTVAQRVWLNLELTNYPSPLDDLPERTAALLRAEGYTRRIWVSSFSPIALWRFHRALPEVPLALLVLPQPGMYVVTLLARLLPLAAVHFHAAYLKGPRWRLWQKQGYRVLLYTLNESGDLVQAWQAGVDGVFTDVPARALVLRQRVLACQSA